ncbi:hypothetical protein BDR04DRAFT_1112031 [Suillus decipiens]|nr:hypothetical protein BDR04DRAFT_1112031 [Suillus decipiens]
MWILLLLMVGVFYFVAQTLLTMRLQQETVAWCHWNVSPGAFRCGARIFVLRSYTVFTVDSRRRHHHVLCTLCRHEKKQKPHHDSTVYNLAT